MKNLIIPFLLFSFTCSVCFGQSKNEKFNLEYAHTLKQMFEVSGTEKNYMVAVHQMIEQQKKYINDKDINDFLEEFEKEITTNALEELTTMLTPIYSKYFSETDLKEIIAFYKSPVGKKLSKYTPIMTQESIQVGEEWGLKVSQKILNKILERENIDNDNLILQQ